MKRILLAMAFAAGAVGFVAYRSTSAPAPSTRATSASPVTTKTTAETIGVDALMKDVDHHRGPAIVEGVVKSASAETKMLDLIDCEEFRACGTTTCARLVLPVRWSGSLPAARETVGATGEVRDDGGKLVFVASAVEIVSKEPAK